MDFYGDLTTPIGQPLPVLQAQQGVQPTQPAASPLNSFLNSPGMAMAGQAFNNIAMARQTGRVGGDPIQAYQRAVSERALLNMRQQQMRLREKYMAEEESRAKEKFEIDKDPMYEFRKFVEARGLQDRPYEEQLEAFRKFKTATMKMNTLPADLQTYQAYANMTPEQRQLFQEANRAMQTFGGPADTRYRVDPVTGQRMTIMGPEETIPIASREAGERTRATEEAKRLVEREGLAPQEIQQADYTLALLDSAIKHPGREAATGGSSVFNAFAITGSARQDFLDIAEQLRGNAFVIAYQGLKGGGPITDTEGKAATAAQVRLNTAQSEQQYLSALNEMVDLITRRKQKAQESLGIKADQQQSTKPIIRQRWTRGPDGQLIKVE